MGDAVPRMWDHVLERVRAAGGADRRRLRATVAAVRDAARALCESADDRRDARAYAALFDACVVLQCTPLLAASAAEEPTEQAFVAFLRARSPHWRQFPADRTDECPIATMWIFRDAFLMGPMRSGGSAQTPHATPAAEEASATATAAAATSTTAAAPAMRDPAEAALEADDAAFAAARTEGPRGCEHVPVPVPAAVYARYDRLDTVFVMLHKGWPHKLQQHELANLVATLLDVLRREEQRARRTVAGDTEADAADASASAHHEAFAEPRSRRAGVHMTQQRNSARLAARRTIEGARRMCRWWAYARLGRWPGDVPLMDWDERAELVRAIDWYDADAGDPAAAAAAHHRATAAEAARARATASAGAWLRRILGDTATRASHVAGATLALQAVVIESVRRLAPLRQYLLNHARWAAFEEASVAARNAWRAQPCGRAPVPAFFSELTTMAPRDTDPNMWLIYVGRCLRSRGVLAAPLDPAVDRSFRIGIAAIPDLMRLVWPLVAATRAAAAGERVAPGGVTDPVALREIQYYVGRLTATGAPRSEWDARVPPLTVCSALALGEVIRAALAASGVDATGCAIVFRAIRDLYVCSTGPRVQATALVNTIMRHNPRIATILVALHNICVDHAMLHSTALDAHTTAMQVAARARRVGVFSGGRDDWLMVCHNCRRPHTLVSEFDARPVGGSDGDAATASASAPGARPGTRRRVNSMNDHGFRDVAVDTHDMTFMCNQRGDGVRELVYPVPQTGNIVGFHSLLYTICPQCGVPMQFNPQLCVYVNFTFACANCSALVLQRRAAAAASTAAAAAAAAIAGGGATRVPQAPVRHAKTVAAVR